MENNIAKVTNPGPPILLSICVSTYNRAEWLAKSLKNWETLYPVPLHNVEFLVCDNTSTDRTPEVVEPYVDRSGFAYYRNEHNVGMLGNLRETARRARGQYIWILGDDDLLMPGSIERILQALGCHPDVALLYLNYAYTNMHAQSSILMLFFEKRRQLSRPRPIDSAQSAQSVPATKIFSPPFTLWCFDAIMPSRLIRKIQVADHFQPCLLVFRPHTTC